MSTENEVMSSGRLQTTLGGNQRFTADLRYDNTYSHSTNTSQFSLLLDIGGKAGYSGTGVWTGYYIIDGKRTNISIRQHADENTSFTCIGLDSFTDIPHNQYGLKRITVEVSVNGASGTVFEGSTAYYKGTIDLKGKKSYPYILECNNFTDEDGCNVSYLIPRPEGLSNADICISFDGNTEDISYRNIDINSSSYKFNFTQEEQNSICQKLSHKSQQKVFIILRSVMNGETYIDSISRTLQIVNAEPIISPTVEDINPTTLALTGDKNKLIRYYSTAKVASNAAAKKSSVIVKQKISNGGQTINSGSGSIYNAFGGNIDFYVEDSRGYSSKVTLNQDTIPYIKLTCNADVIATVEPDNQTKLQIDINGNFYNGSFGAKSNFLHVWYRYRKKNENWTEWDIVSSTIRNNHYSASFSIPNLPGGAAYEVQGCAQDILAGHIYSTINTVSAEPIFDWSYEDFNFNVPVSLSNHPIKEVGYPQSDTDAATAKYVKDRIAAYKPPAIPAGTYAPGGYGLGETFGKVIRWADMDSCVRNGFYTIDEGFDINGSHFGGGGMIVVSFNENFSTQLVFTVEGIFFKRNSFRGVWRSWVKI